MTRRALFTLAAIGSLLLGPAGAVAQRMDLATPPVDRPRGDVSLPRPDNDLYPHRPSVVHDPAFLAPLSLRAGTGRIGVAGWSAPNTPRGSRGASDPDSAGWLGFGVAGEWPRPRPGAN